MVTIEALLDYMATENTDTDSPDQIVESFKILAGNMVRGVEKIVGGGVVVFLVS